jgi:hypothetical protein
MAGSYWNRIHRRAVLDARHALGLESAEQTLIRIVVSVVGLAMVWLIAGKGAAEHETAVTITAGLVIASVFPLVYLWKLAGAPAKLDAELTLAHQEATKDTPTIDIRGIVFDPNGPTEMYVDIILSNPGRPTAVHGWLLTVSLPGAGRRHLLEPRWVSGAAFEGAGGYIRRAEPLEPQLDQGARRPYRVGFTVEGVPPLHRFGIIGATFRLSAKDVRGNEFGGTHVLTEAPPPLKVL